MTIRLVHLSDMHFGCENPGAAEAAIGVAHSLAPDLTIISGDLTANGRREEFEAARAWLRRLPEPQMATPGNHDVPYWSLSERLFAPFELYREFIGPPEKAAAFLPGLTVRGLSTARGAQLRTDWSKGAIDLATVRAAAADMSAATRALKVFVCHHPLAEARNSIVTGDVRGAAAAIRILGEAGVDLILSGHTHDPFAFALPGAAGSGRTRCYAVGAGTLSTRTRLTPPGFSVIEADAETLRVSFLAWTGDGFEKGEPLTFARRVGAPTQRPLAKPGASPPAAANSA